MTTIPLNSEGNKVQVIVRCRPFLSKEIINDKLSSKCLQFSFSKKQILIGNTKEFYFDEIYDEKTNQNDIFDQLVKPLVAGCLLGYNATVFAYGQTGSGKTHTMGTSMELISTDDEGIIPRAARFLFDEIESNHHGKVMNIRLSFLEIYNEEMRDLLHPEVPSRDISIREDHLGRIFFTGARDEIVTSVQDVFKFLERGTMNRSTGETLMNDSSSRSHAIFTISIEIYESQIIESKDVDDDLSERDISEKSKKKTTEISSYIHSKLHLVDLAGSERAKRTGAVGVRLKESVGINQGLLSLGKVIRALTTTAQTLSKSGPQNVHVPYRESKLTRFLQDSLGGNSRTLMIACISPSELDIQETLTTLQYASRARAVQNKIKANVSTAHLEIDTNLIDTLRDQLLAVQTQLKEQQKLTALMIAEKKEREDDLLKRSPGEKQSYANIAEVISEQKRGIILERLTGIQRILQNAVKYFDHGVDHGIIRIESDSLNTWEDAVCNIHNSASILEDISSLVKETSGESVASTVEALGGQATTSAQLIKKIQALQIELTECREDLKRDEEIFGEKVLELKQTRRALKKSQEEVARLTELLEQKDQPDFVSEHKDHDSLEISRAVAATEPHVSQLMEDLEHISKEKEKLGIEKEIAEKKCNVAISLAEKQKEEYDQSRHQLSRQLKELEIAIKMKQEVISSLTREQQEISSRADSYAAQIIKLETESQLLKSKLKEISEETLQNDESVREKQRIYESKIKTAQQEISLMRKQWRKEQERLKSGLSNETRESIEPPSSPLVGQPNDLLEELKSMKDEHTRLRLLLEEDDARQKQQLKVLSQQMESYKKKVLDSQKQIKLLEARNVELQQSLGAQSQSSSLPPPPKSAGGKDGSYLKRHSGSSTPTGKTLRPGSFSELPSPVSKKLAPGSFTKSIVERLIAARTSSEEEEKFKKALASLQVDKEKLEQERDALQRKGESGEAQLRSQLKEMEGKVSKLTKEMTFKKKEYKKYLENDSNWAGTEDELRLKTDISESERTLRSLRVEYRAELTIRLDRGFLSNEDQQRLQEIKDELEANDAETQLNQLHLLSLNKNLRDKTAQLSTAMPQTVLYQEISQEILDTLNSNSMNSTWNADFISSILQEIVDNRMRLEGITNEKSSLQLKYDEKNGELEQLVMVLHRTRNELNKRLDKQQKEYENKISFLIQQLRNSEVKLHENSLLLRSSYDMLEQRKKMRDEEEKKSEESEGVAPPPRRPHTTPNMIRPNDHDDKQKMTMIKKKGLEDDNEDHGEMSGDVSISSFSMEDGRGTKTPVLYPSQGDQQEENMKLINDLKRKLDTERCRREILEKRNGELLREIRKMSTKK